MIGEFAWLLCAWLAASFVWSATVYGLSRALARPETCAAWPTYWLGWVLLAVAPPIAVPLALLAPLQATPPQIDTALVLVDLTAAMQRNAGALLDQSQWFAMTATALFAAGVAIGVFRLACQLNAAAGIVARAMRRGHAARAALLVSEEPTTVFCLGGRTPSIVVPRKVINAISADQLDLVVRHELAHVERRDPLLFVVLSAVSVVFWFSPFVSALIRRARLAAEMACDARALAADSEDKKLYASTLLQLLECGEHSARAAPAFGSNFAEVRARLRNILRCGAVAAEGRVALASIAAALVFALAGGVAAASTGRLAIVGNPNLLAALATRVDVLYGAAQCDAGADNTYAALGR